MNTAEKLNLQASLLELITGYREISDAEASSLEIVVRGVQLDSRLLQQGDLFLACFGRNHDARNYNRRRRRRHSASSSSLSSSQS